MCHLDLKMQETGNSFQIKKSEMSKMVIRKDKTERQRMLTRLCIMWQQCTKLGLFFEKLQMILLTFLSYRHYSFIPGNVHCTIVRLWQKGALHKPYFWLYNIVEMPKFTFGLSVGFNRVCVFWTQNVCLHSIRTFHVR